jgi:hypothetical protein
MIYQKILKVLLEAETAVFINFGCFRISSQFSLKDFFWYQPQELHALLLNA